MVDNSPPTDSTSSPSSPSRAAIPISTSTSKQPAHSRSHHHSLSLSPRSNPSDLDEGYNYNYLEDHPNYRRNNQDLDDQEVFSNPDTSELESTHSDGTGATSPAPNSPSPGPGSPLRSSITANDLNSKGLNGLSGIGSGGQSQVQVDPAKGNLPTNPRDGHHSVLKSADNSNQNQIRNLSSTPSSPTALRSGTQSPISSYQPTTSSSSQLLPSANELPSDPREANTLSQLFAHQVDTTSTNNSISHSPVQSISTSNSTFNPTPNLPTHSPVLSHRNIRSRPTTRASSPERIGSERLGSVSPSSAVSASASPVRTFGSINRPTTGSGSVVVPGNDVRTPSIFERDIEHRDASHVMSKQEAVDVAIPTVLDDAAEAIVEDTTDVSIWKSDGI